MAFDWPSVGGSIVSQSERQPEISGKGYGPSDKPSVADQIKAFLRSLIFARRSMRRGDPERIRQAQRAGFVARLASARGWDRERASELVARLQAELAREGLDPASPDWYAEMERRAGLA